MPQSQAIINLSSWETYEGPNGGVCTEYRIGGMMKEKFTPGPWAACTDDGWEGVVHSPEGRTVATCPWDERAKADARLIAQAPALLDALCDLVISSPHDTPDVLKARAAIAKATGDNQ